MCRLGVVGSTGRKYLDKYYDIRNKAIEIIDVGLHERFVYAATLSTQFTRESGCL